MKSYLNFKLPIILCLIVFPLTASYSQETLQMPELISIGQSAPITELKDLERQAISFPQEGYYNLIFYWSLFCHSCLEEIPALNNKIKELNSDRLKTFFISLDTDRMHTGLENFANRRNLEFPVLMEEIKEQAFLSAEKWGVMQTPTAFIVSPENEVIFVKQGPLDLQSYFQNLKYLLENEAN